MNGNYPWGGNRWETPQNFSKPPLGVPTYLGGGGVAGGRQVAGGDGGGWLDAIGKFITQNPELVTGLAGTAADVYGGIRADKRAGQALKLQEEELRMREEAERRRSEEERVRMLIQAMSSMRPGLPSGYGG